jgi:peptidoglycan/xylan/chitin deacetylase (PgdA/CDA1 family)
LWCRDDDACPDSPALRRLLEFAAKTNMPVALAVIPALAEQSLVESLETAPAATILQHGYAHRNYAPPGERNWELGSHRPIDDIVAELEKGRIELARRFGRRFLPVMVPPWNRIDPAVVARLPAAGFQGLSTFGMRTEEAAGIVQCNTHVDLIAWRRGRLFIGRDAAVDRLVEHLRARREGQADSAEPTGILTHHLDLDDDAWSFFEELVRRTQAHRGAAWIAAEAAFRPATSARSA